MANDDRSVFISTAPATRRDRIVALVVVAMASAGFVITAPFAGAKLARLPALVAGYQSALAVIVFVTAVLLFSQVTLVKSRALLLLACGCLFTALAVLAHTLLFVGLFTPASPFSAGPQSVAWLSVLWHAGLPAFTLAYASSKDVGADRIEGSTSHAILLGGAASLAALAVLVWIVTARHDLLPVLIIEESPTILHTLTVLLIAFLAAATLAVLWMRRPQSVLDVWLMAALIVSLFEIGPTTISHAAPFDLGSSVGSIHGLCAAGIVLTVLLVDTIGLQLKLSRLLHQLRERQAERERLGREQAEKPDAAAQLRQAQKMEAIGQLTGGIAHDFNNILTVITGSIGMLADAVADKPELAEVARLIDESATRGAQLTQQLLAFARKQPLQPIDLDVNALVVEAARLLRPTLGEHIEISAELSENAWTALVDPNQLTTAMLNLALNARDAMPTGGKLTLETGNVSIDEDCAHADGEVLAGDYVMIAVSDTGHGIPAADLEKVFDPFFSTKGVGKGTGLGLSMVFGFLKQSGGHVKLLSEVGHGTCVRLYLPRSRADRQAAGAAATPTADEIASGEGTILIVEDDALVRRYVVAQIGRLGYVTLSAADATEALDIIDGRADIDLLFTDVTMPGAMNGAHLADAARQRRPSLKTLFTSGYAEDALVHHGRVDDGVLLLAKPYRKAELARMIRLALER